MGTYGRGLERLKKIFEDMATKLGPQGYEEWLEDASNLVRQYTGR